jgi:hypothetical protein
VNWSFIDWPKRSQQFKRWALRKGTDLRVYQLMLTPGSSLAPKFSIICRMQWQTKVLVFPLFPTLLGLIKKRAPPYPHAKATSEIYCTVVTPRIFPPSLKQRICYFNVEWSTVNDDIIQVLW